MVEVNSMCTVRDHLLDTMKRSIRGLSTRVQSNLLVVCDSTSCCNVLCCLPYSSSTATTTTAMNLPEEDSLTRVLLVGSRGIGKTCLARTIADGAFPSADYLAHTLHNNEAVTIKYKTNTQGAFKYGDCRDCYDLELTEIISNNPEACPKWDDIKENHLIFMCFDITNAISFEAIRVFYFPRVNKEFHGKKYKPNIILVGLKEDEKRDKEVQPITPAVAEVLAKEIGANCYVETSSLKHIGIDLIKEKAVFSRMYKTTIHQQKVAENRCNLF